MVRNVVLRLDKFEHEKIVPRRNRNRSKKVKIFHRLKGLIRYLSRIDGLFMPRGEFHAFFKHLRTCIFILFACISFYAVESLVLHYILLCLLFHLCAIFFFFFCKKNISEDHHEFIVHLKYLNFHMSFIDWFTHLIIDVYHFIWKLIYTIDGNFYYVCALVK